MPDDSKSRGLTLEQKAACRREFEDGAKIAPLAEKYAIARNTLKAWIKKEGWTRSDHAIDQMVKTAGPPDEAVAAAVRSNIIDLAKHRAREKAEADGTIERVAEAAKSDIERIAAINSGLLDVAEQTIARLRGDKDTVPLRQSAMASEAADIKAAIEAVSKTVDLYGKLHGLGVGDAILGGESDDDREWAVEHVVIDSPSAAAS